MQEPQVEMLPVYVELDALLDTRLATIARHWPEAARKLAVDDAYYLREMDAWPDHGISKEAFHEAYAKRDVDTLRASIMTQVAVQLNQIITSMEMDHSSMPLQGKPIVYLNVWPYKLSEEQKIAYTNAVMNFTGLETMVRIVEIRPEALTMREVRNKYAGLFMYDFARWVNLHQGEMRTIIAPQTTVFAPTIYLERPPSEADLRQHSLRADVNPARLVELTFAEFIGLDLMPTYFFCPIRPDKSDEWQNMFFEKNRPHPDGRNPILADMGEYKEK